MKRAIRKMAEVEIDVVYAPPRNCSCHRAFLPATASRLLTRLRTGGLFGLWERTLGRRFCDSMLATACTAAPAEGGSR